MQISTTPIVRSLAALEMIAARGYSPEFAAKARGEARSVARGAALATGLHAGDYLASALDWIAAATDAGADPKDWTPPAGFASACLTCHASSRRAGAAA